MGADVPLGRSASRSAVRFTTLWKMLFRGAGCLTKIDKILEISPETRYN